MLGLSPPNLLYDGIVGVGTPRGCSPMPTDSYSPPAPGLSPLVGAGVARSLSWHSTKSKGSKDYDLQGTQ